MSLRGFFILGGISSYIRSEIYFYGGALAEPYNMISDRIYDDIPSQMKILNIAIPILFVLFNIYTSKTLYFVQNVSFVSDVNHYIDQSLARSLLT